MKRILPIIAIILALITIIFSSGCRKQPTGASDDISLKQISPDFYKELTSVRKMNFASLTLNKTITTERSKWYKVGKRIGVYSYDVYLKSYIDLEDLTPDRILIDESKKRVSVLLPDVKVEVAGRSPDFRKEYENIGFFRSVPDSKERAELKEIANEDFNKEFSSNPEYVIKLKQVARRKARAFIKSLIEARGYEANVRFEGEEGLLPGSTPSPEYR